MVRSCLPGVSGEKSEVTENISETDGVSRRGGAAGGTGTGRGTGEAEGGGSGDIGSDISPSSRESYVIAVNRCGAKEDIVGYEEDDNDRKKKSNSSGEERNGCVVPARIEWNRSSGPPSLSMSVDLHDLVSTSNQRQQDFGHYSASPERADNDDGVVSPACTVKIVHDEEESYEGFGSIEGDADDGVDSPGGSSEAPSPTGTSCSSSRNPRSPNSTIGRHSWLRTSLRRTPPSSGRKRLSSNALASQLYRSGSFNSSGRGSTCDATDDMYNMFLEDDVIDLDHRTKIKGGKRDVKINCPAEYLAPHSVSQGVRWNYCQFPCEEYNRRTTAAAAAMFTTALAGTSKTSDHIIDNCVDNENEQSVDETVEEADGRDEVPIIPRLPRIRRNDETKMNVATGTSLLDQRSEH